MLTSRQMTKIETRHVSRSLLLKINRVYEELEIVTEVLKQQNAVLEEYRLYLHPLSFDKVSMIRNTRFQYERKSLDRISKSVQDRITKCDELRDRLSRMAIQIVQLVDTEQDNSNQVILIFTFVTIFFLPASVIAGYYAMDLPGVHGDVGAFWKAVVGTTSTVFILSGLFAYRNAIEHLTTRLLNGEKYKSD